MDSGAVCSVAENAADACTKKDCDVTQEDMHAPVPFACWFGRFGTDMLLPRAE
jgi:hypothetical protein